MGFLIGGVLARFDSAAKTLTVQTMNGAPTVETVFDFFGNQSAF
jgi:hypothetical protein